MDSKAKSERRRRLLRHYLRKVGLRAIVHQVVDERPPSDLVERCMLEEGWAFRPLSQQEVLALAEAEERQGYIDPALVMSRASEGYGCLGLFIDDELVGFNWFGLGLVDSIYFPRELPRDVAYLFDMWVSPQRRGLGLAPTLRCLTYRHLLGAGASKFVSITDINNGASRRFKEKLGARPVSLRLNLTFRNTHSVNVLLRRYSTP